MTELKLNRFCISSNSPKNFFSIVIIFFVIVIIYSMISPFGRQFAVERMKTNSGSENKFKNWFGAIQDFNIPRLNQFGSFEETKSTKSSLVAAPSTSSSPSTTPTTDIDGDDAGTTKNVYLGDGITQYVMSTNEYEEVEREMKSRKDLLQLKCEDYWIQLRNTTARYMTRQRYDLTHRIMYCENYKVGSSTWATHLLHMNNVTLKHKTPIHSFVKKTFPPLKGGDYREAFMKKATTFLTVRDPFERLVSAYMDKLSINITRNDTTWATFGKIQQNIKRNLREERRRGLVPTFHEFATYLANVLSPDPEVMSHKNIYRMINNHWKPVYLNCAPCIQRYDTILKMETFSRDSQYLKQKLGLDIEVSFVRKGGRNGHIDQDRTVNMFNTVGMDIRERLYDIYKYDFELFGYDWTKYFKS